MREEDLQREAISARAEVRSGPGVEDRSSLTVRRGQSRESRHP